ncbi:MAG: nucleotidyltransferase domain-containing protein [Sedimentisphaerales bacterium]|nr:nucleotidyltransferase domain-containing protein [Sedimentisphaerales bacterium]
MGKEEILTVLEDYKQSHQQQYGIKALGLFGSVAKGSFDDNSDIDIFVELEKPDIFLLADIKQDIEQTLHITVDIVRLREKMNPVLKQHIVRDGIYV